MSSMCHTMHSGYPWRLFHFEEKVKSVVKSACVCSPRLFHVLCVTCTEHALMHMSVGLGRKEES